MHVFADLHMADGVPYICSTNYKLLRLEYDFLSTGWEKTMFECITIMPFNISIIVTRYVDSFSLDKERTIN